MTKLTNMMVVATLLALFALVDAGAVMWVMPMNPISVWLIVVVPFVSFACLMCWQWWMTLKFFLHERAAEGQRGTETSY